MRNADEMRDLLEISLEISEPKFVAHQVLTMISEIAMENGDTWEEVNTQIFLATCQTCTDNKARS